MEKLNDNYTAESYLSEFWQIVKENFEKIEESMPADIAAALDKDGFVKTKHIGAGAVTAEKIGTGAVTVGKLANGSVNKSKLGDDVLDEYGKLLSENLPTASINQVGGIKLHSGSGVNRSGINVGEDGTAYIAVQSSKGLARDGAGQIHTVAATEAEIDEGTQNFKPITPANVEYAVKKHAPVQEVADDAITYEKLNDEVRERVENIYTSISKVGYWVDYEHPIWRVIIEHKLTNDEKAVGQVFFADKMPIKGGAYAMATSIKGFVVNSHMVSNYSDGALSEGVVLTEFEPFCYSGISNEHEKVIGWIEFVMAEENVLL